MEEIAGLLAQKIVIPQDVRGTRACVYIVKLATMAVDVRAPGYVVLVVAMKTVDVLNVRMAYTEIDVNRHVLNTVGNLLVLGLVIVGPVNLAGMDRIVNALDTAVTISVMHWAYAIVVWTVGMGPLAIRHVQNIVKTAASETLESVFNAK